MPYNSLTDMMLRCPRKRLYTKRFNFRENIRHKVPGIMVFFHRNYNLPLKLVSIIAIIFLTTFISAMLINLHLHIAPGGQIYIHSHPVEQGTQSGKHSHSQSDYTFLNILKNIGLKLLVIILVLAAILQIHRRSVSREPEFDGSSDFSFSYSNRAPPILSVS